MMWSRAPGLPAWGSQGNWGRPGPCFGPWVHPLISAELNSPHSWDLSSSHKPGF